MDKSDSSIVHQIDYVGDRSYLDTFTYYLENMLVAPGYHTVSLYVKGKINPIKIKNNIIDIGKNLCIGQYTK